MIDDSEWWNAYEGECDVHDGDTAADDASWQSWLDLLDRFYEWQEQFA